MDPYAPIPISTEQNEPLTPSLLFQKLAELKVERERLSRQNTAKSILPKNDERRSAQSLSDELARAALGNTICTDTASSCMSDCESLACLDPYAMSCDEDDRMLLNVDPIGGALAALTEEATQALVTTVDEYGDALDAEAAGFSGSKLNSKRNNERTNKANSSVYALGEEDDEYDEDEDDYGVIPRSMPPKPAEDAPIADHVFWQVTCAVHRALDSITLDLPQMFEESRIGGAAMQLVRLPAVASDSMIARALRSRVDAIIHGRLVRHVQEKYTHARYLVVSTVDRDVRDVLERTDLLRDDVHVIGAHLDAVQARVEALVTEKVNLITEALTRYVHEVIPREFDRMLQAILLREGAIFRPVYDRVHDSLLPIVAAFVAAVVTALKRNADWVNTVVVRKVGDDLLILRQQFSSS
ncbi:hypothetical protein BDF19DRAFT_443468 [Syncephalis fuscata]|nr:hypothetical protein BDF19DRAFT_443468 [Syncephalis fuscata]